jgi:hypothetical protein
MAAAIAIPVDFPDPGTADTAKDPPCQSAMRCCPGRKLALKAWRICSRDCDAAASKSVDIIALSGEKNLNPNQLANARFDPNEYGCF